MTKLKHDHTGQVFGMLTVLEHVGSGRWAVRCSCGVEKIVAGGDLRQHQGSRSCGCSQPTKTKGPGHPRWKEGPISYSTAHRRVSSHRGHARDHACSNCGDPAHSWAYRGGSDKELIEERPNNLIKKVVRFSPDPADYDPMCWPCHTRKDLAENRV